MVSFSLEQNRTQVRADFAFYGVVVLALTAAALMLTPRAEFLWAIAMVGSGFAVWTLAEYFLHRYLLHHVMPFSGWHAQHHARPRAFIATPTVLTAVLFALFGFMPVWWLAPSWRGVAAMLGVMLGYLAYIGTHHAVHQWSGAHRWLYRQRRWHAQHHAPRSGVCYGVSVRLWDHVFGSAPRRVPVSQPMSKSMSQRQTP